MGEASEPSESTLTLEETLLVDLVKPDKDDIFIFGNESAASSHYERLQVAGYRRKSKEVWVDNGPTSLFIESSTLFEKPKQ